MISGFFGDEDALFFEIELIATDGLEIAVDALLDTGFSDWLAINNQDLDALGVNGFNPCMTRLLAVLLNFLFPESMTRTVRSP